ncbi:MAG: TatD family hydrolase [Bacteroidota bacterium]
MLLTDTHSHIYLPEFDKEGDLMLERAEKEGVGKILMPAIDTESHARLFRQEKPPDCLAMMGLHPCSVKADFQKELKAALGYLEKRPFVAIGEIGLDFYWDKTFTEQQYAAFHEQVEWALHFDIPISIHSRNATDECIAIVAEHQKGKLRGVFHCFSGDALQAQKVINLGFYLGIGGVVTFKNAGLDKVLEHVALENIVLETDAPYLAPVPFRGKRNEPSYLKYVLEKLAEIKGIDKEEMAAITTANAEKVFRV